MLTGSSQWHLISETFDVEVRTYWDPSKHQNLKNPGEGVCAVSVSQTCEFCADEGCRNCTPASKTIEKTDWRALLLAAPELCEQM